MTRYTLAAAALVTVALTSSACGDDTPTSPTTTTIGIAGVQRVSQLFAGTLQARGREFFSFTVPQDSGVWVTLASVIAVGEREPNGQSLGVGLGVLQGTDCAMDESVVTPAGLSPQLFVVTTLGEHCVAVFDPGTLPGDVQFAVRIVSFQ